MSFAMHGVPVSGGIAIGRAHLVSHALLEVAHYIVPKALIPQEVLRFNQAVNTVKLDLENIRQQLSPSAPAELASFINTHLMILADRA
ncbi:MAG: phosphoenolpyruvate-utilizing N-terminal domain-containing protein, partial [Methylophilaceae bacterium]|nr:phosphoenolpyruvate-utilizing N-terminal domain-containing protein [Methylophilaceae bacterium]